MPKEAVFDEAPAKKGAAWVMPAEAIEPPPKSEIAISAENKVRAMDRESYKNPIMQVARGAKDVLDYAAESAAGLFSESEGKRITKMNKEGTDYYNDLTDGGSSFGRTVGRVGAVAVPAVLAAPATSAATGRWLLQQLVGAPAKLWSGAKTAMWGATGYAAYDALKDSAGGSPVSQIKTAITGK